MRGPARRRRIVFRVPKRNWDRVILVATFNPELEAERVRRFLYRDCL